MIIGALALLLVHIWLLPATFSIKHANWLLGARDEPVDFAIHALRAKRAAANYMESLPAFLVLALLAKIDGIDLGSLPLTWLVLRVVYGGLYLAGTPIVRTLVWLASLVVLVMMAIALL
tara:strand:+ start:391 stop:747 length:357 start_codon:yes stop_codon:yes gene_type:complete